MTPKKKLLIVLLFLSVITFVVVLNNRGYFTSYNTPIKINSTDTESERLYFLINRLVPLSSRMQEVRWRPDMKSFAINKEDVHICMSDERGNLYDDNTLTYVILHELAHCELSNEIGHTSTFEKKFQELLNRAYNLGLYNPSIPMRSDYCLSGDE